MLLTLLPAMPVSAYLFIGDEQGRFVIENEADLLEFADLVNNNGLYDVNVIVEEDITYTGDTWAPIAPDANHPYTGVFDGGGHTIYNLSNSGVSSLPESAGLFGAIGGNGEVKNLTLSGENFKGSFYVGSIAGYMQDNASVSGCINTGDINVAIDKIEAYFGGIAGFIEENASISYCINTGDISANLESSHAGGIVGVMRDDASLSNCLNTGDISTTEEWSNAGGGGGGGSTSATFTVKFDTTGGEEFRSISVKYGQPIGTIGTPKKVGFLFTGWYSDKELSKPYSADVKIAANMTLYASWKVDPARQFILTIGEKEAIIRNEIKTNDVAPQIVNDRTMLPTGKSVLLNISVEAKREWKSAVPTFLAEPSPELL